MAESPYNSYSYGTMGGQYPERVALGLTTEMLGQLQAEAKRHGRTLLAQIRFFCEDGLRKSSKQETLDERIARIEQRLAVTEERLGKVPHGKEPPKLLAVEFVEPAGSKRSKKKDLSPG